MMFAVPSFLDGAFKKAEEVKIVDPEHELPTDKQLLDLIKAQGTEGEIRELLQQGASLESARAFHYLKFPRAPRHFSSARSLICTTALSASLFHVQFGLFDDTYHVHSRRKYFMSASTHLPTPLL